MEMPKRHGITRESIDFIGKQMFTCNLEGCLAVINQSSWGAHAPSRAVIGALADHSRAPESVTI